jgi:hypothetical protein
MPTPTSLAADVAAASLASIADEARVSCNEQMQKSKELDERARSSAGHPSAPR